MKKDFEETLKNYKPFIKIIALFQKKHSEFAEKYSIIN
jgi:hypothetical protein